MIFVRIYPDISYTLDTNDVHVLDSRYHIRHVHVASDLRLSIPRVFGFVERFWHIFNFVSVYDLFKKYCCIVLY